ncbi:GLPGLI family protein [Lacinutrix sp.]|uniref:GLPGLI family protein n=1 Tax=Lacinutrix sp. TaxID=1937692 RepID=UPI0025C1F536|nr:GLPGLI family protein [Lacinutrix sp.]
MILKKYYFFIGIFLLFTNLYGQITEGSVEYIASHNSDKIKAKLEKISDEEMKLNIISKLDNSEDVSYYLTFNNQESFFEKAKTMKNEADKNFNFTEILAGDGKIYINTNSKNILEKGSAFGDLLIKRDFLKWSLTKETKVIGNYTCYKATTTNISEGRKGKIVREILAWYAPDVSIQFGPSFYCGLPGLILELENGNDITFKASKINLNPKKEITIKKPEGKIIDFEEANQIAKNNRNN